MIRLCPDLAWVGDRFRPDVVVDLDPDSGRLLDVRQGCGDGSSRGHADHGAGPAVVRLPDKALLPGFVNAHSHAFQRLIRGRTQRPLALPASGDPDFWSWRDAMYGVALTLSAGDVYHVSRFAFLEMMRTGVTAVGEFHYLHHQPDGQPYPDPNELGWRVIDAARSVGIRIALLNVCYATGGIDTTLGARQRRFAAGSLDGFLQRTAALRDDRASDPLVTVGVAPHSLRAVPREWLPELWRWAVERDAPFHMHLSEQPAEVEAIARAHGARPVEVLFAAGLLDQRLTVVHATHLDDREVALLGAAGVTVCACPTTERDLGDGFLRGRDLLDAGASICLGTDSHTNLDFLEEMRLVEYHERLLRQQRAIIADESGDRRLVAPPLLRMATGAGAASLRLPCGRIERGALADLVAIDLAHPSVAGWNDDTLAATLVLSATPDIVSDVWVGGVQRLRARSHVADAEVMAGFQSVARHRTP